MLRAEEIKEDNTYVRGYFRGAKSPENECIQQELGKILSTNTGIEISAALTRAYNFCLSATDFGDINHSQYFLLRNISVTLAENKQDFYIIDDAEVLSGITPGQQIRVEPMKTLAEASTSGKKSSETIEKVGYFNNMLEVEFKSGDSYVYFVEPDFYDRFVAAPSKGEFLWDTLRGKKIGLVWGYATGTGSILKHTPGGVGGSIVNYAKGISGAPDYKPSLLTEAQRGLVQKEIQIQFLGAGLKYKEQAEGIKRETAIGELRSMFGQQSRLPPSGDFEEIKTLIDTIDKIKEDITSTDLSKLRRIKDQLSGLSIDIDNIDINDPKKISHEIKGIVRTLESMVVHYSSRKEVSGMLRGIRKGRRDFEGIPVITDKVNNLQDLGYCKDRYHLLYDFYHMEDEKEQNKIKEVITKNNIEIKSDTELRGIITRAGAFNYGGHIQYKKWDNLVERAIESPILPVFGSNYTNPHKEENVPHLIGYIDSWGQDDPKQEHLYGTIHTFEPIEKISVLDDPKNIQVSLSMFDDSSDDDMYQNILGFRNVAIALGNQMKGRCESVEGYGSCVVNPIEDMGDQDSNLILDKNLDETISRSSSPSGTRKIIKKKSDLHMPDEKKVKEDIAKFIEDFKKQKDDNLAISTGNEVQGNTHFDEFERTMKDEGYSPAAIASAWAKYMAQNKPAGAPIDNTTGGFVKTAPGLSGDFEEKIDALTEALEKQEKMIKKYEDFFKTEQGKIEAELKAKYIKPLSEENREIIEKMDFDTLEKIKPILDLYINEHPEIMPTDKTADDINELNTNEILKLLGKSKEDLRQNKDDMTKIKEDAVKAMEAKWSKKGD